MHIRFVLPLLLVLSCTQMSCTLEDFEWDNPMDPNSELYKPKAPTLAASPLNDQEGIRLTFTYSSQVPVYVSSFLIERRSATEQYVRIAEIPGAERHYTDTSMLANVPYTYRILSVWKKNTTPSNESSATWSFPAPTGVAFFVPMSTTGVGVTWPSYSGLASGFILERSGDGQSFHEVSRVSTLARTAVDSTPTPGNQYTYRVRAYTVRSISDPSNTISVQFLQTMLRSFPPINLSGSVVSVAFAPDGRHWVSGTGGSCRTWAVGTSSQIAEILNPFITGVASLGSMVVASGTTRSVLLRFDPHETMILAPIVRAKAIAISPDGVRIAICTVQGVALSFSSTGSVDRTVLYDSTRSVAFRPDGSLVASGADERVGVWITTSGAMVHSIPVPANTDIKVGFSSDGTRIIGGGSDGMIRIWDVGSGTEVGSWNSGGPIKALSSKAGKILTVGNSDAQLWDLNSGTLDHTFPGGGLTATTGDLSTNGTLILVGYSNGTVNLWSLGNHWWHAP